MPDLTVAEIELQGDLALDERYAEQLAAAGFGAEGPVLQLADVLRQLEVARKDPGAGAVLLVVDSLGGSSWAGLALCEALRCLSEDGVRVVAHVQGCAGSAAAVAILGADVVTVAPGAVIHPHGVCLPAGSAPGRPARVLEVLQADTWLNAGLLATRTLGRPADVERWLGQAGEELGAPRAVAVGYADQVVDLDGARELSRRLVGAPLETDRSRALGQLQVNEALEDAEMAARDTGAGILAALSTGVLPELVAGDVLCRWGYLSREAAIGAYRQATRHLRHGASIVMLFGKIPTGLKQALGLFTSAKDVKRRHLVTGTRRFLAEGWKGYVAESGEGRHLDKQLDRDARELFTALQGRFSDLGRAQARVVEWGAMPIMLVQKSVNAITWYGAHEQALEEGHADPVAYADSIVRMTQSGGGIKDLAAIQRGTEAWKMLTVMFGYRSVLYNLLTERNGKQGAAKVREIFARFWWLVLMPVVVEQVLFAGVKDDEEPEDVVKRVALEMALLPTSTIPVVDQVAEQTFEGRDMKAAPWLSVLGRTGAAAADLVEGDADAGDAKVLAELVGMITHTPTAALWNYGDLLSRITSGELDEPLQDLLLRSPSQWE